MSADAYLAEIELGVKLRFEDPYDTMRVSDAADLLVLVREVRRLRAELDEYELDAAFESKARSVAVQLAPGGRFRFFYNDEAGILGASPATARRLARRMAETAAAVEWAARAAERDTLQCQTGDKED